MKKLMSGGIGFILGSFLLLSFVPIPLWAQSQPGYVTINSQRTIPMGWFAEHAAAQTDCFTKLQLNESREHGFDYLMTYNVNQFVGDFQQLMQMDYAQARGVKIMAYLADFVDNVSEITRLVNLVKNHPALYGYYLADEPELGGFTSGQVIAAYNAIKAADTDPNHPVFVAFANQISTVQAYLPGTDVAIREMYNLAAVAQTANDVSWAGGKGYMSLPNAYTTPYPTPAEFRYNVFGPISMGAGGIAPFIFEGFRDNGEATPLRAASVYPATDQLKSIIPILLLDNNTVNATSTAAQSGGNNVTFLCAGISTNAVLIAANNNNSTASGIDFHLTGLNGAITSGAVLGESRSVTLSGGAFTDNFAAYGVHIYRFTTLSTVTVSGTVTLGNFVGDKTTVPVTIEIRNPGSPKVLERQVVALDSGGNYSFTTETKGTYDVSAKASHWLMDTHASVNTTSSVVVNFSLVNGDVDKNNEITVEDKHLLEAAMGTVNADCDLDGSGGVVNSADLAILTANLVIPDPTDIPIVSTSIWNTLGYYDVDVYKMDKDTLAGLACHHHGYFDNISAITPFFNGNFAMIGGGSGRTQVYLMETAGLNDINDSTVKIGARSTTTSGQPGPGGMVNRFGEIFAGEYWGNFDGGSTYNGLDPSLPYITQLHGGYFESMVRHNAGDVLSNGDFVLTANGTTAYGPANIGFEWRRRDIGVRAERVYGFDDVKGLATNVNDVIGLMDYNAGAARARLNRRTTDLASGVSTAAGNMDYFNQTPAAVKSLSNGTWVFATNSTTGGNSKIYLISDANPMVELNSTTLSGVTQVNCLAVQSDNDILVGTEDGKVLRLNASLAAQASVTIGDPVSHIGVMIAPVSVLNVTPGSYLANSPAAGQTTFDVSNIGAGTMAWTAAVTVGGDWLTITGGASGTNSGTITVDFTPNASGEDRMSTIRVTALGAQSSPKDVTVTQLYGAPGIDTLIVSAAYTANDSDVYKLNGTDLSTLATHARGWFDQVWAITPISNGNFALIHGGTSAVRVSLMPTDNFTQLNQSDVRIGYHSTTTGGQISPGGMINCFDEIFAGEYWGNYDGGSTYNALDTALPYIGEDHGGYFEAMVRDHAGDVLSNGDFVLTARSNFGVSGYGFEWRRRDITAPRAERVYNILDDPKCLATNVHDVIGLTDYNAGVSRARLNRRTTDLVAGVSTAAGNMDYFNQTPAALASLSTGTWVFATNSTIGGNSKIYLISDANPMVELGSTTLTGVTQVTSLAVQSDNDIIVGTQDGKVIRLNTSLVQKASVTLSGPVTHIAVLKSPTVKGVVTLQNYGGTVAGTVVTIEIQSSPVETHVVVLDAGGNYSFPTALTGNYDLKAKASHWLRQTVNATISKTGTTPSSVNFSLINGDCDGDNEITSTDLSIILSAMDTSGGGSADLNGDGSVNAADLSINLANMDLMGN